MKLADLEPRLVMVRKLADAPSLAEAQGVMLKCPGCYAKNAGPMGTHSIICWFRDRGVPDDELPTPGRWKQSGSSLADLTLEPSVLLPCGWHGYIRNGEAVL